MRSSVARDIRSVFDSPDLPRAEARLTELVAKYRSCAPMLSAWMEQNIPEGLTVFALPEHARKRLRTSNSSKRLNREIKRRTRVAGLFPNENSILRLVTAILMEISEEWGNWTRLLLSPNPTLTFTNQPHLSFSLIRFYRKKVAPPCPVAPPVIVGAAGLQDL